MTLSVRLPERTALKLASLAHGRGSRADVIIRLIEQAEPEPEASATYRADTAR